MVKRRNQPMIDSDSSSSSESGSDLDSELLSLAKKRKNADGTASKGKSKAKHSSESDSDDDDDWADGKNTSGESAKVASSSAKTSPKSPEKKQPPSKEVDSDHEEGEVSSGDDDSDGASDDSDSSSSSSDSEFDDGFDENLMGDDEDRARLNALSEKERETEIFKRIERRDMMRTRWEIERKLKLARRGDKARDKTKKEKKKKKKAKKKEVVKEKSPVVVQRSPSPMPVPKPVEAPPPTPPTPVKVDDDEEEPAAALEYIDPKERSKERKKNVEMNKTDDKRSNAMALLKAKREGKAKREEEEAKRQAEKEREEEKDELESVSGGKSAVKLKASDIYSDDSGSSSSSSDSDDEEPGKPTEKRQSVSSRSSSSEWDEETSKSTKKSVLITTREDLNKLRLSRHKMERFISLPMFEKVVTGCFVRISIGNNGTKPVYRVAEIVGVVETPKIYQFGRSRTNRGLRLKHGAQERVFRLEFISNQDFSESEYDKWRKVCDTSNVQMPAMETLSQKQREINEALNYEFKDEDVHKIIAEKDRFRQRPTNYAMKKTMLMKERDAALLRGDDEIASTLGIQIDELEERANELDKRRSSSISLISYINDRNRKRNVEEAERAIMEEIRATKGMRIEDPFTRRTTQPRMAFNKNEAPVDTRPVLSLQPPPLPGRRKPDDLKPKSASSDYNLYKLHDFEIDLDVPLPNNPVSVLPKAVSKANENAPKRSLNLEDYKKKRGLI